MSLTDDSTPGIGPQGQGTNVPPPGHGGDDEPPPAMEGGAAAVGAAGSASPGGEEGDQGDQGAPVPPVEPPPVTAGNAARTSVGTAAQRSASPSALAMRPFIEQIEDYVNASITFEDACLIFAKAVPDSALQIGTNGNTWRIKSSRISLNSLSPWMRRPRREIEGR